jgi:hypothetical protein
VKQLLFSFSRCSFFGGHSSISLSTSSVPDIVTGFEFLQFSGGDSNEQLIGRSMGSTKQRYRILFRVS